MTEDSGRSAGKHGRGTTRDPGAAGSAAGRPAHIVWAAVSAVVLVIFAPALFAAGFFTNELVSEDEGKTVSVAQPSPPAGTPTPAPAVAASADDDPFIGPENAAVTIIEFSDYQ